MKLYMAGNFPLMLNIDEEREMKNKVNSLGREYLRLLSFYYKTGAENVLEIRQEVIKEEDAYYKELVEVIGKVMADIYQKYGNRTNVRGSVICPKCQGILDFSLRKNGHIHGKCRTKRCLSWMQ